MPNSMCEISNDFNMISKQARFSVNCSSDSLPR